MQNGKVENNFFLISPKILSLSPNLKPPNQL